MRPSFRRLGSLLLAGAGLALAAGILVDQRLASAQASASGDATDSVATAAPASSGTQEANATTGRARVPAAQASGGQSDRGQSDSPFGAFTNSKNRGPVNIQSGALALDYKSNAVLFTGKVHATQADGQLNSNTLNVKYGKDFHEVQEMIADGDVHVSQGLRWCTSDHMVMNETLHTVILTGSPICHDAKDQISGTRITVHTDTGRSDVDGPGVKALIFPQESKTRDNGTSPTPTN
ncbi:MAG TPA: LptA/OstA family protein [Candidatus Binataceae bacterium]|nr:LptA/OstA family protein [Candidatus Binataceae bacterium]